MCPTIRDLSRRYGESNRGDCELGLEGIKRKDSPYRSGRFNRHQQIL